ncbi:ribonuclease HII [Acidilutibacter cellobiosedens]|jgi:ribonuclease HII|uniref:Ribonuclease HII n=1 Tax=Acidilutibacter cellobiosedens TaxID=2507161 RepID=A0A410QC87_9FIRM|nr:ribonuclease HII [Acidilutibacter cellobiosedens]MBE6082474.1 ribonuclease HII [Tissierellaceae bacterium]QAT61590.1 ribonuclease HII [Acidilutibacter cellobiosedens]
MIPFEEELTNKGFKNIACIDEVGRGCLAGDVIACAIIMPKEGPLIEGIRDSKKLSAKKREELYPKILDRAVAVGIGRADCHVIDEINIKQATRLAMKQAVLNLKGKDDRTVIPDYILIDAENIDLPIDQKGIIKGDDKCYGIACASIVAKVYRDMECLKWDKEYKGYNIAQNKGYGTKEHREAIKKIGPSPIHRMTFLKNII